MVLLLEQGGWCFAIVCIFGSSVSACLCLPESTVFTFVVGL
jgi:hypothetical protein